MLWRTSHHIKPGHDEDIKLYVQKRVRLPRPWGECIDQQHLTYGQFPSGSRVVYTKYACLDECYEIKLYEECHCRDITAMGLLTKTYPNATYCGDIKKGFNKLFSNMTCMNKMRSNFDIDCAGRCQNACDSVEFHVTHSSGQWPDPSQSLLFYHTFIEGTLIEESYFLSLNTTQLYDNRGTQEFSYLLNFIREHFTKVKIFFPRESYILLEDTRKYTFSEVLSQIASLLNFWVGITVIFFVEILDFFLQVCHQFGWCDRMKDTRIHTRSNRDN